VRGALVRACASIGLIPICAAGPTSRPKTLFDNWVVKFDKREKPRGCAWRPRDKVVSLLSGFSEDRSVSCRGYLPDSSCGQSTSWVGPVMLPITLGFFTFAAVLSFGTGGWLSEGRLALASGEDGGACSVQPAAINAVIGIHPTKNRARFRMTTPGIVGKILLSNSSRSRVNGKFRASPHPVGTGIRTRPCLGLIRIRADDLATGPRAQGLVRHVADRLLDEFHRTIRKREIHSTGVEAPE
jgi:hypothetical protein